MLYRILYVIGQAALHQYFRSIERLGAPPRERGPVVIVANHFNGLLDALLVAGSYWRQCWITAKSTLFTGPLGRVLAWLPVLPIYRPGEADPAANQKTFQRTSEVLIQGGAIVVFPYEFPAEFKVGERKLHKFKTGAVRMALAAEQAAGRDLRVTIQPVGINYADFHAVGASVTLVFGEPVRVRPFLDPDDPQEGVRACADLLDQRMRELVVEAPRAQYAQLVEQVTRLFSQTPNNDYARLSAVARQVRQLAPMYPELADRFGARIARYLQLCESLDLPPGSEDLPLGHRWRIVLFAPLTLWGWLAHWVPNRLFTGLALRLVHDPYYQGTVQFLLGLVGFPLWYLVCGTVLAWWLASWKLACGLLLVTAVAGTVVNRFGYRLNLLLTGLLPGRRARHLDRLRELGGELRESLREFATEHQA